MNNLAPDLFPQELPELLTIRELASLLKISPRSIWRLVSSGKLLEPLHIGGSIRWRKDAICRWIDQGCPGLTDATAKETKSDCSSEQKDTSNPPASNT